MSEKQICAIDFGSESIRLARSTQNIYAPQIISPNLLNAVRVDRNQGVTAIGTSIHDGVQSGGLILGVNIFDEKLGSGAVQALVALLQEAYKMLGLDRLSPEQKSNFETVFPIPIGTAQSNSGIALARLLERGYPAPRAYSAAKAILLRYSPDQKRQPGDYLIVDCGASHTRMALCKIDSSNRASIIGEEVSGTTGGNEIDRLLSEHFGAILNDPQINRAELIDFVRQFKKGFLNKIRQGSTKFVTRSPFPIGVPAFDLNLEEFQKLSRSYFNAYEQSVLGFLERQKIVPANLKGMLLAGGNAQWPFIINFAEGLVGKDKVEIKEFPEDALVRGLSLTVVESLQVSPINTKVNQPTPKSSGTVPVRTQIKSQPIPSPKRSFSFPFWLALLLEFFPGLFGILGIGWGVGTGTVLGLSWHRSWKSLFLRVPLYFIWPAVLLGFALLIIGIGFQISDWKIGILFLPFWCGVPFASAILAFLTAKNRK